MNGGAGLKRIGDTGRSLGKSTFLRESTLPRDIENLVAAFRESPSLLDPLRLRERCEWLDRLDAALGTFNPVEEGVSAADAEVRRSAQAMCAQLEAVNERLFAALRTEIRQGCRPALFAQWMEDDSDIVGGLSFDYRDELLAGVLQLEEPSPLPAHPGPEFVFYQPTPARHLFHLLRLAQLTAADTLIDLGLGLGHVPLLAAICTDARSIGIEREEVYVASARRCGQQLNLERARFLVQDVREADLSVGTIFYLYTPFTGSVLATVVGRLRRESQSRAIRVCTFGPCTETLAQQQWLESEGPTDPEHITVFHSRF